LHAVSNTEVYQRTLDNVQGGKVCVTGGAGFREPFAKLTSLFDGRNAAGSGQRERYQRVRSAVSDERRLQSGLFTKIKREQEFYFHHKLNKNGRQQLAVDHRLGHFAGRNTLPLQA